MERFSRIERFLGKEKLQKLQNSFVAVIGLGAVCSYAVEGLARSGIGRLLLVDFDKVNPSNINRQLYALESTVGKTKTEVARDRVLDINPNCRVEIKTVFVHTDTLPEIFIEKPDIVIDAIDSLTPKAELLTYCFQNNIPAFASMGVALRTDPTLIKTGDVFDVTDCPLGFQLRRRLRKKGVGRGINCVYSTEPVNFDYHAPLPLSAEAERGQGGEVIRGRARNTLGSLPTVTGIFGLTIANAVIRILYENSPQPLS